jgi:pyridoxine 5'-phosphate synthase PdxJ
MGDEVQVDLAELERVISALNVEPPTLDAATIARTLGWQLFALHAQNEHQRAQLADLRELHEASSAEIKKLGAQLADIRKTGKKPQPETAAAAEGN